MFKLNWQDWLKIAALEPCYGPRGGNATRIYTRDGQVMIENCRMRAMLNCIAMSMSIDLWALRRNYGAHLDCRQFVPLVFSDKLVLTAVKMRTPLSMYDGATGYINFDAFIKLAPAEEAAANEPKCYILTEGGHWLPSLFSLKNADRQMSQANIARVYYYSLQGYRFQERYPRSFRRALIQLLRELFWFPPGPDFKG